MHTANTSDSFDPPEFVHALRETMYNINVSLMLVSPSDLQLFVLLHFRSKYHKGNLSSLFITILTLKKIGLLPRTLIFSRDRVFLCVEDYSKWPMMSSNTSVSNYGTQFEV